MLVGSGAKLAGPIDRVCPLMVSIVVNGAVLVGAAAMVTIEFITPVVGAWVGIMDGCVNDGWNTIALDDALQSGTVACDAAMVPVSVAGLTVGAEEDAGGGGGGALLDTGAAEEEYGGGGGADDEETGGGT